MDEIKNDFSQKRHPLFVLSGYNIIDTLPSLWVRSAFAQGSLLRVEAKGIQNGMKKPCVITYPFVGRTSIKMFVS